MKRQILTFIIVLLIAAPLYAVDLTKSAGQLMDWTLLDDTGSAAMTVETNALDSGEGLDASVTTIVHIDMCHKDGTAADAGSAGFSLLIKTGTTDEDWIEFLNYKATGGTANVGDMNDTTSSGQAVIELTSTTNFEAPADIWFLCDEGTLADSCLVQFNGVYADDDWITVIDNLVNAYDASDNLYDIVDQWNIVLPNTIVAAKVLFYNADADATYACRVKYTNADDIE